MGLYHHRTRIRIVIGIVNVVTGVSCQIKIALGMVILRVDEFLRGCGEGLVVVVADQTWVIARWECNTFASASSGSHTVVIIGIAVRAATPRGHA